MKGSTNTAQTEGRRGNWSRARFRFARICAFPAFRGVGIRPDYTRTKDATGHLGSSHRSGISELHEAQKTRRLTSRMQARHMRAGSENSPLVSAFRTNRRQSLPIAVNYNSRLHSMVPYVVRTRPPGYFFFRHLQPITAIVIVAARNHFARKSFRQLLQPPFTPLGLPCRTHVSGSDAAQVI